MGNAAVTEVKSLLSHLQGKGLGTSIIGGESCLCHIPLLHQNHIPKCPLPNLFGDFEGILCTWQWTDSHTQDKVPLLLQLPF